MEGVRRKKCTIIQMQSKNYKASDGQAVEPLKQPQSQCSFFLGVLGVKLANDKHSKWCIVCQCTQTPSKCKIRSTKFAISSFFPPFGATIEIIRFFFLRTFKSDLCAVCLASLPLNQLVDSWLFFFFFFHYSSSFF